MRIFTILAVVLTVLVAGAALFIRVIGMDIPSAFSLRAQSSRLPRAFERGPDILLEDSRGRVTSLGPGFNPIPISDHQVLLIRGARLGYGDAGCDRPETKDRVVIFDAATRKESVLYDKPIADLCAYEHADLSPSGKILYIVLPCNAAAGCLAVIDLSAGSVKSIPGGAMDVFVIRGGQDAGDLLYMRRSMTRPTRDDPGHIYYPYIHAHPDGSPISVVSDEVLVLNNGNASAPKLRAWLRSIHGRIYAQGEWIP